MYTLNHLPHQTTSTTWQWSRNRGQKKGQKQTTSHGNEHGEVERGTAQSPKRRHLCGYLPAGFMLFSFVQNLQASESGASSISLAASSIIWGLVAIVILLLFLS